MSKQALKRVRRVIGLPVNREPLPAFCWPGGYPLLYIFADGGALCPKCANENIVEIDQANRGHGNRNSHGGWAIAGCEPNYEEDDCHCDHCGAVIPCAYSAE